MGFIYEISGKYRENRELHKKKRLVPTLDYFFCAMGTDEPDYRYIIGKMVKGRIVTAKNRMCIYLEQTSP